ncbi:MAG: hypothetical protein ACRDRA_11775 [Pseudonocardiaceae bacterium]
MSALDVGEQVKLLLAERVHQGHITKCCGFYFDDGQRIWFHPAAAAYSTLVEVGRLELIYPPDSGVWRQADYGPGELVKGVHVCLTEAELARRVLLTERGLCEYKELCERAESSVSGGQCVTLDE